MSEAFPLPENTNLSENSVVDMTGQEAVVRESNHFGEGLAQANKDLDRIAGQNESTLFNLPLGYTDVEGEYHDFKQDARMEFINIVERANGVKDYVAKVQDSPDGTERDIIRQGKHGEVPVTFVTRKVLKDGKVGDILGFFAKKAS